MGRKWVLRGLAGLIDLMVILLPAYMLLTVLKVEGLLYQLLPQLLFMVYNILTIVTFSGKTIGKYFAQLFVYTEEGGALHLGIREVGKLLYFLPKIGVLFLLLSLLMGAVFKIFLHDWLGKSHVLLDCERKLVESRDHYEEKYSRRGFN